MAVKPVAAFFAGTLMFICAGGVAVLMAGYVAVKRNQFKKQLASQA